MKITDVMIQEFRTLLTDDEKSAATVEKYLRDAEALRRWLDGRELSKQTVLEYKRYLCSVYKPTSVNSIISSLNKFFSFFDLGFAKVKTLKIQKQLFASESRVLTKNEYHKLLNTAKQNKNERLYLIMQTICSCGIRVSELKYITVEAVKSKSVEISLKGKYRQFLIPKQLCTMLKLYAAKNRIKSGSIFITRTGKNIDRSNIWSEMKALCDSCGIQREKVFPHNLRHLFARTYYMAHRDIVRLADILGHSNINTTRIYTMELCSSYRNSLQMLGLLLC